jgi:small subunit ribosomal protein S17
MLRKKLKGTIKRVSGRNTVGVEVVRVYHHPRYRKRILTSKVYLAHMEGADAVVGMSATIEESRPISKRKNWVVVELEGRKMEVGWTRSEIATPASRDEKLENKQEVKSEKKVVKRKPKAESRRRKEPKK